MSEIKGDIFQIGELNPIGSSAEVIPDLSQPGAFIDLLGESAKKIMNPISFKLNGGTLGLKAVCLRAHIGPKHDRVDMNAIRNRNTNKGTIVEESYVIVKAYIPEIHAACPLPRTLPPYSEEDEGHDLINKFFPTTFYAPAGKHRAPMHGELIWVDYANPDRQEGGIYNGPVGSFTAQIFFPNNGPIESSKDAFNQPVELADGTVSGAEPEPAPVVATPAVLEPPAKPVASKKKPGVNLEKMFGKKKSTPNNEPKPSNFTPLSKEDKEMLSEYQKNLKQIKELKEQGMSDYDAKCLVFGWDCEEGGAEYMG